MTYVSEFVGSLIFLLGGYAYMCNISLKKTLIGKLNYIELAFAWSLAVGFGLAVAVILGGPAYLNPGAVFGSIISGTLPIGPALLYLLMEFLAAGAAVLLCILFFWDSMKASKDMPKRGIFSAYPVEKICRSTFSRKWWPHSFSSFLSSERSKRVPAILPPCRLAWSVLRRL